MVTYIISRLVVLTVGTLYPAYASYKAVKTRNVKEYVKWMMYWIVFALFTCVETICDIFASILPFYYEAKILFIFWLISPWTKGATYLYRKFVHPTLTKREQEIDAYLAQASEKGLKAIKKVGQNGMTIAANAVMQSAMKGQSTLIDKLTNYSTFYGTAPVKQLEGVPEEQEPTKEAREAKEHMHLLRSEDMTDSDEDADSPHYRNKQLMESLETFDTRLREEQSERDNDLSYKEELYERERLERQQLEREKMEWEQEQERLDQQERYKNRRLLQSTHDLPPQPTRHHKTNPSKRDRNFTTSLTREEFDNANNMFQPADDEISIKRSSSLTKRPYASTENLSRRPSGRKKHESLLAHLDESNILYSRDDGVGLKRSQSLRRPYASTENLSRTPVRKYEQDMASAKTKDSNDNVPDPLAVPKTKDSNDNALDYLSPADKEKESKNENWVSFFSKLLPDALLPNEDQETFSAPEVSPSDSSSVDDEKERDTSEQKLELKQVPEIKVSISEDTKDTHDDKNNNEDEIVKNRKDNDTAQSHNFKCGSGKNKESGIPRKKKNTQNPKRKNNIPKEPLVRTSSERSLSRATRSSSRLKQQQQKPPATSGMGIQITRY